MRCPIVSPSRTRRLPVPKSGARPALAPDALAAAAGAAILLMLACGLAPVLRAEPIDSVSNPRTRDGTWVTDTAGMLKPETIAQLNALAGQLERETTVELAVVVIRSLDGLSVEEYALKLFERWGIGKKGRDNGVLLLWASGDRRVRVEVGYGLEDRLTDGKTGAILDQYVVPAFKAQSWDAGVLEGAKAIAGVVRDQPVHLAPQASESYQPEEDGSVWSWVLGMLGFGTAGGGSIFGYRRWRRYRRRSCPQCQAAMAIVPEVADDQFLQPAQQLEERLRSVDYDVWQCTACDHRFVLRYARWLSSYGKCPQCTNRTVSSSQETLRAATTSSGGQVRVTEDCQFCTFHRTYTRSTPKLSSSSSSSSRGSSSFGGGRSGGGGASRSY